MAKQFQRENKETKSRKEFVESLLNNISLLLEDTAWRRATETIFGENADKFTHDNIVRESIDLYRNHPTYKQIVELNKSFVLGAEGFHRPVHKNALIQYVVDYLIDNKENQRTFSGFRAQEKIIESRDLKGEVFFKIYINKTTGECIIRQEKDTSKIVEIITLAGDSDYRLYYKYKQVQRTVDLDTGKTSEKVANILIPDIMNDDAADITKRGAKSKDEKTVVFGYLATFGDASENDGRGYPVYMSIFKYLRAHKQVAEDATTMLKALTRFAWKKKFKGDMSSAQMTGLKNLASTFTNDLSVNKVAPATASTLLEGASVDNQQVEVKHNGAAFWDTSRILIQQISSGSQKMEHYFGNPANANLATATSMELPMMKDFQRQQAEFAEVIETILKFCVLKIIEIKGVPYIKAKAQELEYDFPVESKELKRLEIEAAKASFSNLRLTVRMPEILDKQVQALVLSTINSYNAGLISDIDASYIIYSLLGVRDIDERISLLYGDTHEPMASAGQDLQTKAAQIKAQQDALDEDKKAKGEGGQK